MRVLRWASEDLSRRVDEALDVYCRAMNYSAETAEARKGYVIVHTRRPGFRAVAAEQEDGRLLGFGYGYTGSSGQWWHDEVRRGLPRKQADRWLSDSFELCELHVLPGEQGKGLGRRMLTLLLDGCPHSTVVLSTPEGETLAWHLYRTMGFSDVRRHHRFPGDDRDFAVLGRELPLEPAVPVG